MTKRLLLLTLVVLLSLPALPAAGGTVDLTDLVACLTGGGVEAVLTGRVEADGGGRASLSATLEKVDRAALGRIVESANAHFAGIAKNLADHGIQVGKVVLVDGDAPTIRTTASSSSLADLIAILSDYEPVAVTLADADGQRKLNVTPRPALHLLAPFLRALTVEVELPAPPAANNATAVEGNKLRWTTKNAIPMVEFAWPVK